MTEQTYGTSDGVEITDALIEKYAAEAEAGYKPEQLRPRRGRPVSVGDEGAAGAVPVRLDAPLDEALTARAAADHTSRSEVVREALRAYLGLAA